jgi:hypothetical protein
MANEAHNVMNDRKTDRQDAQHVLRLLNMISADLGSERESQIVQILARRTRLTGKWTKFDTMKFSGISWPC